MKLLYTKDNNGAICLDFSQPPRVFAQARFAQWVHGPQSLCAQKTHDRYPFFVDFCYAGGQNMMKSIPGPCVIAGRRTRGLWLSCRRGVFRDRFVR